MGIQSSLPKYWLAHAIIIYTLQIPFNNDAKYIWHKLKISLICEVKN